MKIALAQINPTVGDIKANSLKIKQIIARARLDNVEMIIFSELSLLGYPPKDLLLKPQFIQDNLTALEDIAAECTDIAALVGYAAIQDDKVGKELHNAAALLYQGKLQCSYYKKLLPTYDVFDELRYFTPAKSQQVIEFKGKRLGLTICEDIWRVSAHHARRLYRENPFADLAGENIDMVINISASPFVIDKNTLPTDFLISAWTTDKDGKPEEIMGIKHKTLAIEGVQFHPESILTKSGSALLNNFIQQ